MLPAGPRRAFARALTLSLAGALVLALVEVAFIGSSAMGYFDGVGELGRFALFTVGMLLAAGLLAGVVEGVIAAAIARLFPSGAPTWIFTLLAAPPIALVAAQIFRGPKARTLPAHDLLAVGIALVALVVVHGSVAWLRRVLDGKPAHRRASWAIAGLSLVATLALYQADQKVLPRLYPWFHLTLSVGAFALAQLFVAALAIARGRDASSRVALAFAGVALVAGVAGIAGFHQSRGLRTFALERTAPTGRLVRLAERVRPAAPARTVAAATTSLAPRPIFHGPHLGAVDVVLITVDAMRADRLRPSTAPTMTALAESGVTFDRAYAQVPHTSFSIATLLTGKHVYSLSALGLDAAHHETLAQVMRRERYKTAAFYPPSVFFIDHDRLKGLEQSNYGFEYVKYEYLDAVKRTDQIIDFYRTEQPERAFVWVHYLEPHEPYDVHPGLTHGDSAEARYDGEVRFVDQQVQRLVEFLKQQHRRALVIIAADHGEEFGEHGGHYHGTTLYEEQVRVPLAFALVDGSGIDPAHVAAPVGLVDVAPTVLGLLGVEPSLKMRGQDLSPLFSQAERARFPVETLQPQFAEIDRKKMIVDGNQKLICDLEADACQLFDLSLDPKEQKDRSSDSSTVNRLRARLEAWMAAETRFESQPLARVDDEARRVLERGRLGDKSAARPLARLLAHGDREVRVEAARLLVSLPPDPSVRSSLEEALHEPSLARWAQLGLARIGDAGARREVAGWIHDACTTSDAALCARAALALGDVGWLGRALDRAVQAQLDEPLTLKLADALAASGDARAYDALVPALAPVRTRAGIVDALARLGDARAIALFERWLPADPYIPVRARMAKALATLAPRDPSVRSTLEEQADVELEPMVMRALVDALAQLGSTRVTAAAQASARGAGELWLVGDGDGAVEVMGEPAMLKGGIARVVTRRAGPVSLRARDGSAQPRWAFWRASPPAE